MRNESGSITPNFTEINKTVREYHEQLCTTTNSRTQMKWTNPQNIKSTKTESRKENGNKPVMTKETESAIKNFPTRGVLNQTVLLTTYTKCVQN